MPFGHGQAVDPSLDDAHTFPQFGGNRIICPHASETIASGQTFTIRWTNITNSPSNMISLFLEDATNATEVTHLQRVMQIASTENNGVYEWKVPLNVPSGDSYIIETQFDFDPKNFSYSEKFRIIGGSGSAPATPAKEAGGKPSTELIVGGVFLGVGIVAIGAVAFWLIKRTLRKRAASRGKIEAE
ncbi:hypothetical protein ABW19_dt0207046 [Dactylella cylindrospora]|nr:hypothetical protein ABW19_dt0207046 [Dactylella cylindrospora]